MRILLLTKLAAVAALFVSCAQQQVELRVDDHAEHEGLRYADEVAAQSPFDTLSVSWSGAVDLMEERNLSYRKAKSSYREATAEKPALTKLRSQLKSSVKVSVKDVLKPKALAKSLNDPLSGLPKQIASVSGLKDISHEMQQTAWGNEGASVEARLQMRRERAKLYTLLNKGEVIDAELKRLQSLVEPEKWDPKYTAALNKWRASVQKERSAWLDQVRNFFNAEYFDVNFRKDGTAMPLYRNVKNPDLSEWQRWNYLSRSQSLVKELRSNHQKSKPAVPGTRAVKSKVNELMNKAPELEVELDTDQVRGEVRKLISNWRGLKRAQAELSELVVKPEKVVSPMAELQLAQKSYRLRQQEIKHASVVWLMDEYCWTD